MSCLTVTDSVSSARSESKTDCQEFDFSRDRCSIKCVSSNVGSDWAQTGEAHIAAPVACTPRSWVQYSFASLIAADRWTSQVRSKALLQGSPDRMPYAPTPDSPSAPTSLLTEDQRALLDAALALKAEGEPHFPRE